MNEWDHPLSREGMYQLETIDLLLSRWTPREKFRPVRRPWDASSLRRNSRRLDNEALHRKLRPHLYPKE